MSYQRAHDSEIAKEQHRSGGYRMGAGVSIGAKEYAGFWSNEKVP